MRVTAEEIHEEVEPYRHLIMSRIAEGKQDVASATESLRAIRWLERVSNHLDHLMWHLQQLKFN